MVLRTSKNLCSCLPRTCLAESKRSIRLSASPPLFSQEKPRTCHSVLTSQKGTLGKFNVRGSLFCGAELVARINVEDAWYLDETQRRQKLIDAVRERPPNHADAADGMAMRAWRLAQRYWKDGRRYIPEIEWAKADLEPMITVGLAERRDGGVYVCGAEAQHEWLVGRSKGGKSSSEERPRDEKGRLLPKNVQQPPADVQLRPAELDNDPAASSFNQLSPASTSFHQALPLTPSLDVTCNNQLVLLRADSPIGEAVERMPLEEAPAPTDAEAPVAGPKIIWWNGRRAYAVRRQLGFRSYEQCDVALCARIASEFPDLTGKPIDIEDWANEMRLLRGDRVAEGQIGAILDFCAQDEFWSQTIGSPSGLRKNWDEICRRYAEFKQWRVSLCGEA